MWAALAASTVALTGCASALNTASESKFACGNDNNDCPTPLEVYHATHNTPKSIRNGRTPEEWKTGAKDGGKIRSTEPNEELARDLTELAPSSHLLTAAEPPALPVRQASQVMRIGAVLYFNTNKTGDIDKERDDSGYVMPWEKRDALELFARLRDWQEKYNPVRGPTQWSDIAELKAAKHVDDLLKLGSNYFLFRDPCNRHRPDFPVTDVRLRNLWLKLMEELERRMQRSGETLVNGEPVKLVASYGKDGQPSSALFDLHALRVTMITAMYEEGVPPEILMKIVGHASVIMTLYYTKLNAEIPWSRGSRSSICASLVSQKRPSSPPLRRWMASR